MLHELSEAADEASVASRARERRRSAMRGEAAVTCMLMVMDGRF